MQDVWKICDAPDTCGLRAWDANVRAVRVLGVAVLANKVQLVNILSSAQNETFRTYCVDYCDVLNVSGSPNQGWFGYPLCPRKTRVNHQLLMATRQPTYGVFEESPVIGIRRLRCAFFIAR